MAARKRAKGGKKTAGTIPSLHRVQHAIEETELRVRAFKGKRAEKAKILKVLGTVKKRLGVLCRQGPAGSKKQLIQFFRGLADE